MVSSQWQQSIGIKDQLFSEPYRYEFHQAVKILEQLYPDAAHLGEAVNPHHEVISISSRVDYVYPPSDIYTLETISSNQPFIMRVNFLGIAGVNGPLPMPFTEKLIRRNQQSDFAFQDFLDIFNHRLLSIFHRIRKKYWVGLENCSPEKAGVARVLFSLCGLGLESFQGRLNVPDRGLLNYSALLWKQPRSAAGLEAFVSGYFAVPTKVEPWFGQWLPIDGDQQTRLSQANHRLGASASLGQRFWDQTRTIRLHLGPLAWQEFLSLLPQGHAFAVLKDLTAFYLGIDYHIKISLHLKTAEVPPLKLGKNVHLGWTSWLPTKSLLTTLLVEI